MDPKCALCYWGEALERAETVQRRALAEAPNNGRVLYALAELYRRRGDGAAVQKAEAQRQKAWIGERQLLSLDRL